MKKFLFVFFAIFLVALVLDYMSVSYSVDKPDDVSKVPIKMGWY